jgi:hypothetical protein
MKYAQHDNYYMIMLDACFAFNFKVLGQLKGQKVCIIFEDDNPIFKETL